MEHGNGLAANLVGNSYGDGIGNTVKHKYAGTLTKRKKKCKKHKK